MPLSKSSRQDRIRQLVQANGEASVGELCALLSVSEATIRRDLEELATERVLHRSYGRAVRLPAPATDPPVFQRARELADAKEQIARATARLIVDGETVFLGSGSTVLAVARHLKGRENLTVISNSLPVINVLADVPRIMVIVLGGLLRHSELSMIGHLTEQAIAELRADKVILGMRAADVRQGLTSDYLPETMTDRSIVHISPHVILVADHTKFGRIATSFVAPISMVHTIVTDAGIDPETLAELRGAHIDVVVAEAPDLLPAPALPNDVSFLQG